MTLAWRQYRLERRMFWRNPSAAFFNFLLPLLLLALFGAVFAGEQQDLDVVVPGIAGLSVMSATFVALAYNLTFLRETGVLKRLRGTPMPPSSYFGGLAASAVTNVVLQLAIVIVAGTCCSASRGRRSGSPWPCSSRSGWSASRRWAWPCRTRSPTRSRRPRT